MFDKIKNQKISINFILLCFVISGILLFSSVIAASQKELDISAYIINQKNKELANGDHEVRFAIYTTDRKETDAYPSNSDQGERVWEETQTIKIQNGILNATLGTKNLLPDSLTFSSQDYYLGIRIDSDSEMVPRKKMTAVPLAVNSSYLNGVTLGSGEGDIPQLGPDGLLDKNFIPKITKLGKVSAGKWEGDTIANNYIADALSGKTYNGLDLTSNSDGFSIEGGSVSRALSVIGADITLNQNLSTVSSPVFSGLTLSNMNGVLKASSGVISGSATTSDLSEGTNLYYTDARARASISATGALSYSSATGVINLNAPIPIVYGGTNATSIGSAGSVPYSTGSAYAFSDAGISGQVLVSSGAGAPTWGTVAGGTIAADSLDMTELKDTLTLDANLLFDSSASNYSFNFDSGTLFVDSANNRVGIGTTSPTAVLHLKAGTATASTAPLKFTSGTLLTAPEAGAVEFLTDAYYGTITTGAARKTFAFLESPSFTTPTLGAATATTINGNTITTGTGTLTLGAGKTFTASNTLTLTGTDGSTLAIGTGGTLGTNAYTSTAYAPLASPVFTGTVTIPTPFTLGATSVTTTGTQLNYLNAATGTTGTTSTNLVFSTSPTLITPALGTPTALVLTNATGLPAASILAGTFGTGAYTMDTSLTVPTVIGGTATTSDLNLQTTSGIGATGADMHFLVGNNGATEAMTIINSGNVGVGTTGPNYPFQISSTINSNGIVMIDGTLNSSTIGQTGLRVEPYIAPDLASSKYYFASSFIPYSNSVNVASGGISGFFSGPYFYGTGTLGSAFGGYFQNMSDDSVTVTSSYGVYIDNPSKGGTSTITTNYGLYVVAQTTPTNNAGIVVGEVTGTKNTNLLIGTTTIPTGSFSIYNSSTDANYFAGNVGIGTTAPANDLHIFTNSTQTGTPQIFVQQDGTGDAAIEMGIVGDSYIMGIDNSDSDKFKISYSGTQGSGVLGTSDRLTIDSSGNVGINASAPSGKLEVRLSSNSSGANNGILYIGQANTNQTLSTEISSLSITTSSRQWATGALPTQREVLITQPTYSFVGASTITDAATLGIAGAPIQSTNATITNTHGLLIQAGAVSTAANSYGLTVNAQTGATNNYAAAFLGGNIGIGTTSPTALLHLNGTAGIVPLEVNSNETTTTNNVLMLRSDVASADDAVFRVQANGAVYADGAYTGTGADYAEYFITEDSNLKSGETVCVDTQKENAVKRCVRSGDNDVMGIVSQNPSVIGNNSQNRENDPNYKIIAMLGQINANATNENGPIKIGDSLTPASAPGYLRKADSEESTVGVALQNFNQTKGSIQIMISRRNKSLTVEKVEEAVSQRITDMNVEDQVNKIVDNATGSLTKNIEIQLATLNNKINSLEEIAAAHEIKSKLQEELTNILKQQIAELQAKTSVELNIAQLDLNTNDISYLKQLLGVDANNPGDISIIGKFTSQVIETGTLIITTKDEAKKTIGTASILPKPTDEDKDGIDDITKKPVVESDGKSVTVKTKLANKNSKIFITPKVVVSEPLAVTEIKDEESFKVEVKSAIEKSIEFDWWIVGSDN